MNAIDTVNGIHYHAAVTTSTSPSAGRRQRQRDDVRARILDAARRLFAERGYEAVTMQQVAAALEYTAGAVYRHFPSKGALVAELVAADFAAFFAAFRHLPSIADPVRRIREAGRAYVEFGVTHPHHYRMLFMTPGAPADAAPAGADRGPGSGGPDEDAYALLRGAVREAMAAGRFRDAFQDPETVSQALWAGVHGVVALAITMGERGWVDLRPAHETNGVLADALLVGLARPGDPALADISPPTTEGSTS